MLSIDNRKAVTAALKDQTLDPALRALIGLRVWQMDIDRRRPLAEVLQVVVVQPGDPPEAIHAAVRFSITYDQAEQPAWRWLHDHVEWFELTYLLPDRQLIVFVADHPDTNETLRFNCHGFACRPPLTEADELQN